MRVLVTGATGFVGTHLVEASVRRQYPVLGLSREGHWRTGTHPSVIDSVELMTWNVDHPAPSELIDRIRRFEPTALVHLAAISIPADCGSPEPTPSATQTNVQGTCHALDLADALPTVTDFVLASSCHVYANDSAVLQVVDEQSALAPASGYGWTKLRAEQAVQQHVLPRSYRRLIVRGFQQTGPHQPARLIVPEWVQMAASGQSVLQVRCLNTVLDLADIRDTVAMMLDLIRIGTEGVFNLASGIATSGRQVVQAIERCAGRPIEVRSQVDESRFNPIADMSRMRQTLGTIRTRPLWHTIADIWATHRAISGSILKGCDRTCLFDGPHLPD